MKLIAIILLLCATPNFARRRSHVNYWNPQSINTSEDEEFIQPPEQLTTGSGEQPATSAAALPKILKMIEDATKSKSAPGPINLNLIVVPVPMIQGGEAGLNSMKIGKGNVDSIDLDTAESSMSEQVADSNTPAPGIIPTQTGSNPKCPPNKMYNTLLKMCVDRQSSLQPTRRSIGPFGPRRPRY